MIITLQTLVFFRESLLSSLNVLLSPYYRRLRGTFSRYSTEVEEDDEDVFAEFDEEKGVVFYPAMYAQRYAAVSDCLMDERWCGKLCKVVDLGYHDMSFIKYLKDLPGVQCILGVDIESIPLRCSSDLLACEDYTIKRENPLQITLFEGNAADPDYRLIGSDAVVAIEMIEHMLPHDLDRLVHTLFGFVKPWVAVITTPNADFNQLFKSLEKNGLRRMDHFFEWSREQFHDWCSNIVSRYPQFAVTCQGVGPGPAGTEHLGCCSQLALFINKDYVKQQDLNLDSLALISNVPSPQNIAELVNGFESPVSSCTERIFRKDKVESLTDCLYSNKQSCVTLIISPTSPNYSITSIQQKDKMSQCNLDTEVGKNFLMFNYEDMYYTILVPRRKVDSKVYEIEDVNSRLNCTTFQARKFSKTTQNLLAKNKIDSFSHTREVVSEIHRLTKMLNVNKDPLAQKEVGLLWSNINWGENAPYWNQYYKVVRDYNYPFEQKSEECRILDLLMEEINRLVDTPCGENFTANRNKLKIPIDHLMKVVRHITDDVDKVKDLLEWNGYEVLDDVVVHSRLVADVMSVASSDVDWPENDSISEIDTFDVQSTTISDGSALAPDIHGRSMRRALDKKVHALRMMLSADEDITMELNRVVCRLMKLALHCSRGKEGPPPSRWMQYKLLDLLTLTEKAIVKRKMTCIATSPLHTIGFDESINNILNKGVWEDRAARIIVDKYNHLIQETDNQKCFDDLTFGFEDEIVEAFSDNHFFKDFSIHNFSCKPKSYMFDINNHEVSTINNNLQVNNLVKTHPNSPPSFRKSLSSPSGSFREEKKSRKRPHSKISDDPKSDDKKSKKMKSKTRIDKNPVRDKISSHTSLKTNSKKSVKECGNFALKSRRSKASKKLSQPSASKPIPGSLIELCHPEVNLVLHSNNFQYYLNKSSYIDDENNLKTVSPVKYEITDVAATEESFLINIVMDDMEETIALRRSIGTNADLDCAEFEQEIIPNIGEKESSYSKLHVSSEDNYSQTIFLYDINEPSTSKGVRHVSMDVQCGNDTVISSSQLISPPSSATRLTKKYSTGICIDSLINVAAEKKSVDLGTCTNKDEQNSFCKSSTIFSKGIKIEDSQNNLKKKSSDFGTITNCVGEFKYSPEEKSIHIKNYSFGTVVSNTSAAMNENISFDNEKYVRNRNVSTSDFLIPGSKSDMFITSRADSLSNLLINFEENCKINPSQCRSPGVKAVNERNKSYNPLATGIIIRDSFTDIRTECKANYSPSSIADLKLNNKAPKSDFPAVFAKLKMTDLVSDVSLEHDSRSRYVSEKPDIFRNSLVQKNQTSLKEKFEKSLQSIESTNCSITKIESLMTADTTADNEIEDKGYIFYENFGGSATKVNFPEQTLIFQNDPIKNACANKNKDFDMNVLQKVEFLPPRIELLPNPFNYNHTQSVTCKTEMLKPVSSTVKMEDSTSECYGSSFSPSPKSFVHGTVPSGNTCDLNMKQSLNRYAYCQETLSPTELIQGKLSVGGIHIHSFKDRQISEDIVFQGKWKRYVSRVQRKSYHGSTIVAKKIPELVIKARIKKDSAKEKLQINKIETMYQIKSELKKPLRIHNTKPIKTKQEVFNNSEKIKKVALPDLVKAIRANNKTTTKVASNVVASTITSKNTKKIRPLQKPLNCTATTQVIENKCSIKSEHIKKENINLKYLPPYLRRKKLASTESKFVNSIEFNNTKVIEVEKELEELVPSLKKDIKGTGSIKSDLMKVQDDLRSNISYVVFRNDIENTNPPAHSSQSADITNRNENNNMKRVIINKRSSSPISQNSSTCSTSESITTVRASSNWTKASRRHSTSSNKSSIANTDSETSPKGNKNRKFSKKSKINKKADGKDQGNKENLPESSRKKDICQKNIKSAFLGQSKNLYMTKLEDSNVAFNEKYHTTKSSIKTPAVESKEEKNEIKINMTKNSLQPVESSSKKDIKSQDGIQSEASNLVLLVEPHKEHVRIQDNILQTEEKMLKVVDSKLLMEWFERGQISEVDREATENAVLAQMRQLVEERLDFIGNSLNDSTFEDSMSQFSYRTVVEACDTEINNTLKGENENAMNHSLDAVLGDPSDLALQLESTANADLISFKSVTSASKYSDYFLAESDTSRNAHPSGNKMQSSVLDIFERKTLSPLVPHTPGTVAGNSYNGFSSNVNCVMGDQPDYVNAINSDINSLGVDVTRPLNSEEMFVSGRSSDTTFESCVLEEEVSVPDWLFHVMNPQLGMNQRPDPIACYDSETGSPAQGFMRPRPPPIDEENEQQELVQLRMPVAEPVFDVNGNIVEPGIGLGAGAGDGRGMHSDHSQDSSGRGSSLSSTDASSGQQSEAILIDPSAFTTQFELFHDTVGSSMAVTTLVIPVGSTDAERQGRHDGAIVSTSHNITVRAMHPLLTSDGEADVSSIDTDVPDSS